MEGIARAGQPFMDEKVYAEISRATQTALAVNIGLRELAKAPPFSRSGEMTDMLQGYIENNKPRGSPQITPRIQEFSHVQRVPLNWLTPGPDGTLVPMNQKRRKGSR